MAQCTAENILNPDRHYLSPEAKKRLRWIYEAEYRCGGNASKAAARIGVSREWLTKLRSKFRRSGNDPRSLEPDSRAPRDRSKRVRISAKAEDLIVKVRKRRPAWGKEKVARIVERDHGIRVSASSAGRYMKAHGLVDPKLSVKNERAWRKRKAAGTPGSRERHPRGLQDAGPGALVAKDMKMIAKPGFSALPGPSKGSYAHLFWYQHTMIDSFTRIRSVSFAGSSDSRTARDQYAEASGRFPFGVAAVASDNGGENSGRFDAYLKGIGVLHFWSRKGTPTDNPRVERSHLSDDLEFHRFEGPFRSLEGLRAAGAEWERAWNEERPHQALGYLTPSEFHGLWLSDRKKAAAIAESWKGYMARQGIRLRSSRKEKRVQEIRILNAHLKSKLGDQFIPLKV